LPNAPALEGDAYMLAGKYAEAAATYATALKQAPSTMLAVALAKAKAAAGDADGAASTLRDWTKAHPDDKGVFAMLGTYDLAARRFEDAKRELETAFDTLSQDPVVLNNLAWVYQKTGDSRARSMAERAYLINPNLPQTKDTLAWILVQQGQPQSAMGLLQEASSADPKNPEIRYHLAAALNMTGRREQAVQILTELVNAPATFDGRPEAEKLLAELSKK
jgi:Flp pilus assembly protein TadD